MVPVIEGLNKMNQGAAVGVGPGEQCPQHQEAERERQAVGQGAYGGRRARCSWFRLNIGGGDDVQSLSRV